MNIYVQVERWEEEEEEAGGFLRSIACSSFASHQLLPCPSIAAVITAVIVIDLIHYQLANCVSLCWDLFARRFYKVHFEDNLLHVVLSKNVVLVVRYLYEHLFELIEKNRIIKNFLIKADMYGRRKKMKWLKSFVANTCGDGFSYSRYSRKSEKGS